MKTSVSISLCRERQHTIPSQQGPYQHCVTYLQEDDLEAVYEDPPPKLTAARTAVCAAAVVVGAIACIFVVALVFHHGMNVDDGAEKVGAGLFLV